MDPEESPQPLASSSHQQHSSEHPTISTCPHIDLQALHSRKSIKRSQASKNTSFCISGCTHEKIWPPQARAPRSLTPPNLSESDKKRLVLALGLEEAYKRMAANHKFHIDVVREVAAGQQCLEQADQVLCSM